MKWTRWTLYGEFTTAFFAVVKTVRCNCKLQSIEICGLLIKLTKILTLSTLWNCSDFTGCSWIPSWAGVWGACRRKWLSATSAKVNMTLTLHQPTSTSKNRLNNKSKLTHLKIAMKAGDFHCGLRIFYTLSLEAKTRLQLKFAGWLAIW